MIFLCVPTYREPEKVKLFCQNLNKFEDKSIFNIVVVNSFPGDESSKIIHDYSNHLNIIEIEGKVEEYWSSTVNRGLRYIYSIAEMGDYILICNIDIEFSFTNFNFIFELFNNDKMQQISIIGISDGVIQSSGVVLKNKILNITYHPYSGLKSTTELPFVKSVDLLPGRFNCFPFMRPIYLKDKLLPHYCADYEFSHRLFREFGLVPHLYTHRSYLSDKANSGLSIYKHSHGLLYRMKKLFSIKNPGNPIHRITYHFLIFSFFHAMLGLPFLIAKLLIELLFGPNLIRALFGVKGRGFS